MFEDTIALSATDKACLVVVKCVDLSYKACKGMS